MRKPNKNINNKDIAIVGVACRLPGAKNYNEFWNNLVNSKNSIREITPDRWDINRYYSTDRNADNKSVSKWGGLLDRVDTFDASFFHISPREAIAMDPQQRLVLEETWHCIEDAGISLSDLQRVNTSVFVGVMAIDYLQYSLLPDTLVNGNSTLGNYEGLLANRVSYFFNLKGKSQSIDAACASSLVALDYARENLLSGKCDYAIAAGVNIICHPWKYISFSKAHMLSPEGQCKTFDAQANGYVPGEGVGVLLLEPLTKAIEQGHHIYAILKGSSVHHSGKTKSITAPSIEAQCCVIKEAISTSLLSPETITYVEAHGTGTSLGDPIEIEALTRAFNTPKKQFCAIGSVKTNIGHLEAAAGIAGVIKVILMMRHHKIPKTINIKSVNPIIDFENSPFLLANELMDWQLPNNIATRRAGVSSFGFGGVVAHVVLEEYKQKNKKSKAIPEINHLPFALSARTEMELQALLDDWNAYTRTENFKSQSLPDICYTLLQGRKAFSHRYAVNVKTKNDLVHILKNAVHQFPEIRKIHHEQVVVVHLKPFSAFNYGSFAELCNGFPILQSLERDCMHLVTQLGNGQLWSNKIRHSKQPKFQRIRSFMALYIISKALQLSGLQPQYFYGEKEGELAAAVLSNLLTFETALKWLLELKPTITLQRPTVHFYDVVHKNMIPPYLVSDLYCQMLIEELAFHDNTRKQLLQKANELYTNQLTFKKYLNAWEDTLEKYGITIKKAFNEVHALQKKHQLFFMIILLDCLKRLNQKWHLAEKIITHNNSATELVDLLLDKVLTQAHLAKLFFDDTKTAKQEIALHIQKHQSLLDPKKPYTILRKFNQMLSEITHPEKWLQAILETENTHISLEACINIDIGKDSLMNRLDANESISALLTDVWTKGATLHWSLWYAQKNYQVVPLPVYPFTKEHYWITNDNSFDSSTMNLHPLIDTSVSLQGKKYFKKILNTNAFYLKDHKVSHQVVLPGAALIEMVREAAVNFQNKQVVALNHVYLLSPVRVADDPVPISISFHVKNSQVVFEIKTEVASDQNHAQGNIVFYDEKQDPIILDIDAIRCECKNKQSNETIYTHFNALGLNYGPSFKVIKEYNASEEQALARIELPDQLTETSHAFSLHPSLLDGALQSALLLIPNNKTLFLPFAFTKLTIYAPLPSICYVHVTAKSESLKSTAPVFQIEVTDDAGKVLVTINDFVVRALAQKQMVMPHDQTVVQREGSLEEKVQLNVIELMAKLLGVKTQNINPEEDLSVYGIDSVILTDFSISLEDSYGIELSPAVLFEHRTIKSVVQYLIEQHRDVLSKHHSAADHEKPIAQANISSTPPSSQYYHSQHEDIAIIGMSGVFPGSSNLVSFWQNLLAQKDLLTDIPTTRWDQEINVKRGGFIENIDQFDAGFFSITPREADLMDPQQRLFLEIVWKTIEDAGYTPDALSKVKTGVFAGVATQDYAGLVQHAHDTSAFVPTGVFFSLLANRVSYFLNLNGPSETIDTACSSSLVAIHQACKAIHTGDCEMAIAGGVNALLSASTFVEFNNAGMLSKEGKCNTFDASADGYARGEGAGAILLKPLSHALKDGDNIYGIIRGSAVNHGGRVNSVTVPNPLAQADVIKSAFIRANIPPETITYIETHGTGTPLGDPIEINGLKKAFKEVTKKTSYCGLGSIKTNIGHLEGAAGIAGVIKVLLAMQEGKLPGLVHFKKLNPHIDLDNSPFYLIEKTGEWKRLQDNANNEIPRRAGVSSFGFGGTNAHLLIEEPPVMIIDVHMQIKPYYLITLSAKTSHALDRKIQELATWLMSQNKTLSLGDVSYTLNVGRSHFENRCALIVSSIEELKQALSKVNNGILYTSERLAHDDSNDTHKILRLAESYMNGDKIDWNQWYQDEFNKKISLPTYPFEKERYWIGKHGMASTSTYYYHPVWQEQSLTSVSPTLTGPLLVLDDNDHLVQAISQRLPGQTIVHASNLDEVRLKEINPHYVIYQMRGEDLYPPLLKLTQALFHLKYVDDIKFFCVTKQHGEAVSGFLKTLQIENPKIHCKVIESPIELSMDQVLQELTNDAKEVRYDSNNVRYEKKYEETISSNVNSPLKKGGVYLITGGAGGLGLIFANYLATHYQAKLILTGRSSLKVRQQTAIAELESLGAEVLYLQTDVTDKSSLQEAMQEIIKRFGSLNGVIHSAGVLRDAFIVNKTIEASTQVLAPKIIGTMNLDEITKDQALDFFVMFSSVMAIFGNVGQCDYAYANGFMDGFAEWRVKMQRPGKTVSINWPLWAEGGMQVDEASERWLERTLGLKLLNKESGIIAFLQALRQPETQCLVLSGDKSTLEKKLILKLTTQAMVDKHSKKIKISPMNNPPICTRQAETHPLKPTPEKIILNPLDHEISGIPPIPIEKECKSTDQINSDKEGYQQSNNKIDIKMIIKKLSELFSDITFLSIDKVDLNKTFVEMGSDSIIGIEFIKKINSEFQLNFAATKLYDYPTIHEMSQYIAEELHATNQGKPIGHDENIKSKLNDNDKVENIKDIEPEKITLSTIKDKTSITSNDRALHTSLKESDAHIVPEIVNKISEIFASVTYQSVNKLDPNKSFHEMGSDSIIGIEFIKKINSEFQLNFAATKLYDYPTIHEMSQYIAEELHATNQGKPIGHDENVKSKLNDKVENIKDIEPEKITLSTIKNKTSITSSDQALHTSLKESDAHIVPEIVNKISEIFASVTYQSVNKLDPNKSFHEMGSDSIIGIEFIKKINSEFQLNFAATKLYDYPTILKISEYIAQVLHTSKSTKSIIQEKDLNLSVESKIEKINLSSVEDTLMPPKLNMGNGQIISENKGLTINQISDIASLAITSLNLANPDDDEIQVEVKASTVMLPDLLCIQGLYPSLPSYPFIPGFELSGIVCKVGSKVTEFKIGDEVFGCTGKNLGGHATLANVPSRNLIKKPHTLSHEDAASLPVAFLTAYYALYLGKLEKGSKVFIQTATSSTGLLAIQLAQSQGAEIYATVGSNEKIKYLNKLGINNVYNYHLDDYQASINAATNKKGVDIVINMLSGNAVQKGINLLGSSGHYIELAVAGLRSLNNLDLSRLTDNQSFHSVDVRKLMLKDKSFTKDFLPILSKMLSKNEIKPIADKIFSFSEIHSAYEYIKTRQNMGRIILSMNEPSITENKILQEKIKSTPNNKEIAIVGFSGRFPGAKNTDMFWENLASGKSSIEEVPESRWSINDFYDPDINKPNKTYCKWGGFLSDIAQFDPFFFGLSPAEAELMDPQQRLFLEEAWKTFEMAGYSSEELKNKKCGVFVGVDRSDYFQKIKILDAHTLLGVNSSILSSRISYHLDLKGPSISIDTACSSSLVALHEACASIMSGECEMALAGGACIMTTPNMFIMGSKAQMLSPDGKCHTFDDAANGFVPGECVGVILLKPLDKALADHDSIYGVVKGSGINQDGRTNGITAPSAKSQTQLECEIYSRFDINPQSISYLEAHGTGTQLGDPIEVTALTEAFKQFTTHKNFCAIGSVKTNIGHAMQAAGVASVIKSLLCLKNKKLVPTLNFTKENKHINFNDSPFYVNKELKEWKVNGFPRRIAISSFGFSGTNSHVILEEAPPHSTAFTMKPAYLITFSAKTETALNQKMIDLLEYMHTQMDTTNVSLNDISYTLNNGRSQFDKRYAIVVDSFNDLQYKLEEVNHQIKRNQFENVVSTNSNELDKTEILSILENLNNQVNNPAKYKTNLQILANAYIHGFNLDWNLLYQGETNTRIALPTYPFANERYWVDQDQELTTSQSLHSSLHPFIDKNVSTLEVQSFEKLFDNKEFYLKDHRVRNEYIIPGAVWLEMARAAGSLAVKNKHVKGLSNIVFTQPLRVTNHSKIICNISLHSKANSILFEVTSNSDAEPILHAQGELIYSTQKDKNSLGMVDIARIKKLTNNEEISSLYQTFNRLGLQFGPSFKTIESFWFSETESMAILRLPQHLFLSKDQYKLHPSLIDGALQVAAALLINKNDNKLYLPYSIDNIQFDNTLPDTCYVHAVKNNSSNELLSKFDIKIADTAGKIIVTINNFTLRTLQNEEQSEVYYFQPLWKIMNIREIESMFQGSYLIFDEQNDWISKYKEKLIQAKVVQEKPENVAQIVETLHKSNQLPEVIIYHACTPTNNDVELIKIYETLLSLSKSLIETKPTKEIQLLCLTESPLAIEAIAGFIKTLVIEHPKIIGRVIQLPKEDSPVNVLAELNNNDIEIRYDSQQRWIKSYERLSVKLSSVLPLKRGGVYIITGGLGGLGRIFARYLADRYKAKLILTGRSPLNEKSASQILELEKLGGELLYIAGDISQIEHAEKLYKTTKEHFGKINGIIHAAGVIRDAFIVKKSIEASKEVLLPKIVGSYNLDLVTASEPLDFFVMYSSIASIFGNVGQCDYAYANGFMDSFARYRDNLRIKGYRYGKTLSINWPLWIEGGMHIDKESQDEIQRILNIDLIPTEEGVSAFIDNLRETSIQSIVLKGPYTQLNQLLKKANKIKTIEEQTTISYNHDELVDYVQELIRKTLSDALKIPEENIDSDKPFDNYGVNSLTIIKLNHQLEKTFGPLPKSIFFDYQTLIALSNYFVENYANILDKRFSTEATREQSLSSFQKIDKKLRGELLTNIQELIRKTLSDALKIPEENIESDKLFEDYGVNSLMIIKLNHQLEKTFGPLPKSIFFDYNTLAALSNYIVENYIDILAKKFSKQKTSDKPLPSSLKKIDKIQSELFANIQASIRKILSDTLKIPEENIESDKPFGDFGVNSLMIIKLNHQLEKTFGPLPKSIFFDYNTLAALSNYFVENYTDILAKEFSKKEMGEKPLTSTPHKIDTKLQSELFVKVQALIRKILSDTLKIPEENIESDKPFDDFGVNSLMIIKLNHQLEKTFGPLPKSIFFEYQTLTALSNYFVENYSDVVVKKMLRLTYTP